MKITIVFFITIILFSCSDDDNSDCKLERMMIIDQYDRLIETEEGNQLQIELLIRNREVELDALNC